MHLYMITDAVLCLFILEDDWEYSNILPSFQHFVKFDCWI